MDKLKQLVASKRKATEEEFGGQKFAKRADIEAARLRKLKEEEEAERKEKERKRLEKERWHGGGIPSTAATSAAAHPTRAIDRSQDGVAHGSEERASSGLHEAKRRKNDATTSSSKRQGQGSPEKPPRAELPLKEVIRRLRVLGQPATLFGETEEERKLRLEKAEREVMLEDEAAGGQQANIRLEIERSERERALLRTWDPPKDAQSQKPSGKGSAGGAKDGGVSVMQKKGSQGNLKGKDKQEGGESRGGQSNDGALISLDANEDAQQRLMASFQAAAESIAERSMPVEDRVSKWVKRWMQEWRDDLEMRSEKELNSPEGRQMQLRFRETEQYFRPLYSRLRSRSLDPQLLAGIKLMIDFMKERNYLQAYKIYMGVAIGNAPWPIGVTHVGLHERSAREKISFKYSTGSAHIMNDEATRKFIQALKRLMTFVQKRYPTDPSRSVDFDGGADGSARSALLEATSKGEHAPAPAPQLLDDRGTVKVPTRWNTVIKDALKEVMEGDTQ